MFNEHWKSIIEIAKDIENSENKVDITVASYSILKSIESILKYIKKGKMCVNCEDEVSFWHPKTGEYKKPYVIGGDIYCYNCYNDKMSNEEEEYSDPYDE